MCQRYVYRVLLQAGTPSTPGKGTLKSWLALLARRRAIDRLRAAKARGRGPSRPGRKPARAVRPLRRRTGSRCRRRWPGSRRRRAELIRLQYFEGYTPKEIADRLGLPYETVKKRRQRALARLRKSLLATLILVPAGPAGGLRLCGAAVLRHSAGVRRQHRRRNAVLYPGRGRAAGENDLAAVEITDAVLADGQLSVQIVLTRGPDAADSQIGSGELASTVPWHHMLTTMYAPKAARDLGRAAKRRSPATCSTQDGLAMDGSALETPDAVAYEILFSCEAADLPAGSVLTLDLGWLQLDLCAGTGAERTRRTAYSYELGEYGGVLAIPQLLAGRLVVDLYPLDGRGICRGTGHDLRDPTGITAARPGRSRPPGRAGAVYTGQNLNYNPLNETGFSPLGLRPGRTGALCADHPLCLPERAAAGGPGHPAAGRRRPLGRGGRHAGRAGSAKNCPGGCAQPPVGRQRQLHPAAGRHAGGGRNARADALLCAVHAHGRAGGADLCRAEPVRRGRRPHRPDRRQRQLDQLRRAV